MTDNQVSEGMLHHHIIRFFIDRGYAPTTADLASLLGASPDEVSAALQRLANDHGVVLHPNSDRIWVVHPFSAAPTNFVVHNDGGRWWGNCAWCSLGVAALLDQDVTITTTLGADGRQVDVPIRDGSVDAGPYLVHFPVPMRHAWDNVIYTCSTMLLFESQQQIMEWCARHRIPRGDVQPLETVWQFARVWYGNHLNPNWEKWTHDEARDIFRQFGLSGPIWHIPASDGRF